jgi:hypothetical protein
VTRDSRSYLANDPYPGFRPIADEVIAAYGEWMNDLYASEPRDGQWHKHEKGVLIRAFEAGWKAALKGKQGG